MNSRSLGTMLALVLVPLSGCCHGNDLCMGFPIAESKAPIDTRFTLTNKLGYPVYPYYALVVPGTTVYCQRDFQLQGALASGTSTPFVIPKDKILRLFVQDRLDPCTGNYNKLDGWISPNPTGADALVLQ